MNMTIKKQYEQPALTVYGSVEQLTQAQLSGTRLDSVVPVGGTVAGHLS